ncbi:MAG TPA: nuclear transport factor 2 family protein [Actinomycetota bacterium]|nr:nuclear transport factor 2 family protein [Actinomycetota bacterium]
MGDPAETLHRFYDAFAARDGDTMAGCYAPEATFEDEVFRLRGDDVGDMWRMLTSRGEGTLRLSYEIKGPDRVDWTADYTFGGHPVHNEITSSFTFDADGRIATQVDRFDFPKWAGQALGWKGKVLGRFGFFHQAVRQRTAQTLAGWQARRSSTG